MEGDSFSELLGRLKERSGLSYGVLGKRLHMSASTLHRYVNGDAVPADYAPVERLARACRATPEELVELHRRWVLADARRRQKGAAAPEAAAAASGKGTKDADADPEPGTASGSRFALLAGRRRRVAVLAGGSVAAVVLSAALVVTLLPGDAEGNGEGGGVEAGSTGSETAGSGTGSGAAGADAGTDTGSEAASSESPSASGSGSPSPSPDADESAGAGESGGAEAGDAAPPTVVVEPHDWFSPCTAHYLVDQEPAQVPPPPGEDDARGWVGALGGVAGGEQRMRLTVQGTEEDTVVLEALNVRVVGRDAPLSWNDYQMGTDGCGGPVVTRQFGVDLDAGQPEVTPEGGQRDFPYSVSESDPEVYYLTVATQEYDVSYYLELEFSSGGESGTVRIDDEGQPFRLSANQDQPAYDYPLAANDRWEVNDGIGGPPTSEATD